jgi:hypothetical protein
MKIQIFLYLQLSDPPGTKQGRSTLKTGKSTKSSYLEAGTEFQEPNAVQYCIQAYLGCNHNEDFPEVFGAAALGTLPSYRARWLMGPASYCSQAI